MKIRRLGSAFLFIIAAGATATAPAAATERVERLDPPALDLDAVVTGVAAMAPAPSGWTRRTQLVWNEAKRDLERRAYEAWRGPAEAGLTFRWTPASLADDRSGRIEGRGAMVWSPPGVAALDADAALATYSGEMRDGRRDGWGVYRHVSGFAYKGEWRAGEMHGQGTLALANGDHYKGGFAHGRLHGAGRYVDAEGVVYEGEFFEGRAEGEGLVRRPDLQVYRAIWRDGVEMPGSRRIVAEAPVRDAALDDEFRVGVIVDSPPPSENPEWGIDRSDIAAYASHADGEALIVEPASQRIMDVWDGAAPIHLFQREAFGCLADGGFLGIRETDLRPVKLVFEFDNRSRDDVRIVSAEIAVASSRTIPRPMLQIYSGVESAGDGGRAKFDPTFLLENYGWGPISSGALTASFIGPDGAPVGQPFSYDVSGLETAQTIDMTDALRALGADVGAMQRGFACDHPAEYDEAEMNAATQACRDKLKRSGAFGARGDAAQIEFRRIVVPIAGTVDYGWAASRGRERRRTAPFEGTLSLGDLDFQVAEMGEGGEPEDIGSRAFVFRLDERDYRMRVRLRDTVPAGVTARWRLGFEAEKSSAHEFRMLFELSDGRVIASRPVKLTYVRPRAR